MYDERCEVVLYSPVHGGSLSGLDDASMDAVVDLWAERSAVLGARSDVATVLVFENHGREVGATIDHPHGQIYAFDHVPERSFARLQSGWAPESPEALVVEESDGWRTFVPSAPVHPVSLQVAPVSPVHDLPGMDAGQRAAFGRALRRARQRVELLFADPVPTMMWINQRPFDGTFRDARINVEIVSPWRSNGVPRYIAAAEVATGEYFNPVVPEDLAERLRSVMS
jgi:UDPglucose--hexose-1-phosphate uridylyltransferase